ncbi:hypothetical protein SAMN05192533_10416 [Mesobacillus persicus]|uniref:Uncharacterized protein n=1 Tax=Mesobacillus persicus TaxID=930146 RepID=A0A1H7ZNE4_9BACI|nr:hypothetical protein [Mesobacillus persicus]SEM59793.1 hypothetical protein SAMN05192533_10416 [Mesobacillus persicus]
MNKKFLAAIGISGVLMIGSVYSISANTSGYEMYKDALKKTHQLDSTTMNANLNLKNNNEEIYTMDAVVKTNLVKDSMEGTSSVSNGNQTSKYEMTKQEGQFYVQKDEEARVYTMKSEASPHNFDSENSMELKQDLENLVDVLTKNYQQKITVNANEDGTQEINLELTSSELPVGANAITSLMFKHAVMLEDNTQESSFHDVNLQLPNLKEDILIQDVKVSATISKESYVQKQTVSATITGNDASGKSHTLQLAFDLQLTDTNKTVITPMDLTGLELVEFQHGHGK